MIKRIRYNQEYNGQTYLGYGKNQKNDLKLSYSKPENNLTRAFMGEMRGVLKSPLGAVTFKCKILGSTISI